MQSRFLLSSFGLLSAGKSFETAIDALPSIIQRHPEVLYVIAGRTHPEVARREGEQYRLMLQRRVVDLGLGDHVEFDDRFLSIDELADLLAATDVFVTPYSSREQVISGALTFAIAAGCAVISTPYWYETRKRLPRQCTSSRSSPRCWRLREQRLAGSDSGSHGLPWRRRPRSCSVRR